MSTQKGCKFCLRRGLPLLPVRPAVVATDDTLPHLPASINVPVDAQGETAWTGRLLREGFLYIWADFGKRWINYFATGEGYYYPLPDDGGVPPDVVNGKMKPCITQPAELARASLITLPVKPAGMKNGVFWFCWSEVEWTPAVRKKHEDVAYRSRYMQRFDLDAWIKSGQAEQVIALSALGDTVAEYSSNASAVNVKEWSVAPWKMVKPKEGINLLNASNQLFPDKGAMIFLQDPVAIAQDISRLANSRLNSKFYENPEYKRELALTAAVHGLKDSICAQYERDIVLSERIEESVIKAGYEDPSGESSLGALVFSSMVHARKVQTLEQRVEKKWSSEYGKYYDKSKEEKFTHKFNAEIKKYDKSVIIPMMKMYMACMNGKVLTDYFDHNFDTRDAASGIAYVQSVTDCVDGFQDKLLVSKFYQDKLSGSCLDKSNILSRAAIFNNDVFAGEIHASAHVSLDVNKVPWDKPLDGFKDIFVHKTGAAQLVLEKYQNVLSSAVYSLIEKAINSGPADALVSFSVVANKKIKVVTLTGKRKYFINAVVEELARVFGIENRSAMDRLRHYVDIEMRHIKEKNIKMTGIQSSKFAVLVDMNSAEVVSNTTGKAGTIAMARTLRSVEEVKANVFPNTFRSQLAKLKESSPRTISASTMHAIPLAGSVLSGAFQIFAIVHAGLPKEFKVEETSRFSASIVMAAGSVADSVERLLTNFKNIRWNAKIRVAAGATAQRLMIQSIRFVKWLGGAAGIVGVVFDGINSYDEIKKGNYQIGIAYACSAVGGGILTYAAFFSVILSPGLIIIAVILMLGAAIYLALNIKNDIQIWLMRCLWRKIPENEGTPPAIWPTTTMEIDALNKALQ